MLRTCTAAPDAGPPRKAVGPDKQNQTSPGSCSRTHTSRTHTRFQGRIQLGIQLFEIHGAKAHRGAGVVQLFRLSDASEVDRLFLS